MLRLKKKKFNIYIKKNVKIYKLNNYFLKIKSIFTPIAPDVVLIKNWL